MSHAAQTTVKSPTSFEHTLKELRTFDSDVDTYRVGSQEVMGPVEVKVGVATSRAGVSTSVQEITSSPYLTSP